MSVEMRGQEQVLRVLEQKLGEQAVQRISDEALTNGAEVFVKELQRQFAGWKDTGGSHDEITTTGPELIGGVRTMKVHWKGPRGRYRIIHLNEWGTVKNPSPPGKGSVARAMKSAQDKYRRTIKEALVRGL